MLDRLLTAPEHVIVTVLVEVFLVGLGLRALGRHLSRTP